MEETTDKAGDDKFERKEAETETNTKTQLKVSLFFSLSDKKIRTHV